VEFTLGEYVQLFGKTDLYEIQGYEKRMTYHKGVKEKRVLYKLKNVHTKEIKVEVGENLTPHGLYSIDLLLDAYNDYKRMYEWFGDEEYKDKADDMLIYLKKLTKTII
jgi:hypothetical protein